MPNLFDSHKPNGNNLAQNITFPLPRNSSAPEIIPIDQNVPQSFKVTPSRDGYTAVSSNPILISDQKTMSNYLSPKTVHQYSSGPSSPTTLRDRLASRGVKTIDRYTSTDQSHNKIMSNSRKMERSLSIEIEGAEDEGQIVRIPTFGEIKDEIDPCSLTTVLSRKHLYEVVGEVENETSKIESYNEHTFRNYDEAGKRENSDVEVERELDRKTWEYTKKIYERLLEKEIEKPLKAQNPNSRGLKYNAQQSSGDICPEIKLCRKEVRSYQDVCPVNDEHIEVKKLIKEMRELNQNTRGYLSRKASCPIEEVNFVKETAPRQKSPRSNKVKSRVSHMRHNSDGLQQSFETRGVNDALEKATAHYMNKIMNQSLNNIAYNQMMERSFEKKKVSTPASGTKRNARNVQEINKIHHQAKREAMEDSREKMSSTSKMDPKRMSVSISSTFKDRSIEIQSTRNSKQNLLETSVPASNKSYTTSKKFVYSQDLTSKLSELQTELNRAKVNLARRKNQEEIKQSQSMLSQKTMKKKEETILNLTSPKTNLVKVFRSPK